MRACILLLILGFFASAPALVSAQAEPPQASLGSSVRVEIPRGKVRIVYVESDEGMVLLVEGNGVAVRARRVFLGDGKIAVPFEATTQGFFTPNGKVNAAALVLKENSTYAFPAGMEQAWGRRAGEVYVLTPGIRFEMKMKKK